MKRNIKVILTLSPEHYNMIKRCAEIEWQTVEDWIIWSLKADIDYIADAFECSYLPLPFCIEDINRLYEMLPA